MSYVETVWSSGVGAVAAGDTPTRGYAPAKGRAYPMRRPVSKSRVVRTMVMPGHKTVVVVTPLPEGKGAVVDYGTTPPPSGGGGGGTIGGTGGGGAAVDYGPVDAGPSDEEIAAAVEAAAPAKPPMSTAAKLGIAAGAAAILWTMFGGK